MKIGSKNAWIVLAVGYGIAIAFAVAAYLGVFGL
jgi:hypothetical protein